MDNSRGSSTRNGPVGSPWGTRFGPSGVSRQRNRAIGAAVNAIPPVGHVLPRLQVRKGYVFFVVPMDWQEIGHDTCIFAVSVLLPFQVVRRKNDAGL